MKKLLVLSVLLGLMALPMFASDITFGGDATYGYITTFSGDLGDAAAVMDLTLDVKAAIDDYNSLAISIDGLDLGADNPPSGSTPIEDVEQALVTTDVGAWLGLPVGVKVAWGYDDPDWNNLAAVSHWDAYSINLSPDEYWGLDFLVSHKFVEFELAFYPAPSNVAGGYLLAGLAVKEPIKGLSAEVYYFQNAVVDSFADGWIAVDAVYAAEFGDLGLKVGPGFYFNLADVGDAYKWYAAAKVTYSMIEASLELTGNETDPFAFMDAVVKVKPFDKMGVYGGLKLDFADSTATDTFVGADVGAAFYMGGATLNVGYLITENAMGEISGNFAAVPPDGGLYFTFDVNY